MSKYVGILCGSWVSLMEICSVVVKIFQCGPKWWTDQSADRPTLEAWLKPKPNPVSKFYSYPSFSSAPLHFRTELQGAGGWNLPPWNGTTLQDPHTALVDIDGVQNVWTFPWCRPQWWFLLCYCDNSGIIAMIFTIYLMKIEKHGCSQFIHSFTMKLLDCN